MIKRMLVNGENSDQIAVMDRGLQYGDGVFETMRIQAGHIPLWPYHWRRLQKACDRLSIPLADQQRLQAEITAFISAEKVAVLKLILTRGKGERGYAMSEVVHPSCILMLSDSPDYPAEFWQSGVRVFSCQTRLGINPTLAGIKHLNRLEQVLARNEWQDTAYQEGLVKDIDNYVIEGTMSNFFWVKNNQLYTPALSRSGVEGVLREIVIELAKAVSIPINIGLWLEREMQDADEIFMTNSLIGIWPVSYIFNKTFRAGPVTQQLQSLLQAKYGF